MKLFIFFFFFIANFLHAWDGEDYAKNHNIQRVGALRQIEQHTFSGRERILDVGCGDGDITKVLSQKTQGEVLGIDPDPSMITLAKKREGSNLRFLPMKAQDYPYDGNDPAGFDLITSFNVLMWVDKSEQEGVFQNFKKSLRPGGKLLFGVPLPMPPHFLVGTSLMVSIAAELSQKDPWKEKLKNLKSTWSFLFPGEVESLLRRNNFKLVEMQVHYYPMVFATKGELFAWCRQVLPHMRFLNATEQELFLEQFLVRYKQMMNLAENLERDLPFSHMELEVEAALSER